ncbi:MAG: glutathione S-transferase family protein [Burkholderiales bacterium]|nr:glutathione S-transferase family protein [Burkholderiales bacterium]
MTPSAPHVKLIGYAPSRVMRTIWMLTELGIPYEHDPVPANAPELKQPPYTDWNPNGRVPIVIVDGFAIWESLAINLYLDRKFPSAISLTNLEEQAQGMQWALWVMSDVEINTFDWYLNTIGKPEAERDAAVAAKAWDKMQKPLNVLEASLTHGHLVGNRFTVADLNTAAVMYRARWMPLDNWPRVKDWLERCWAREGGLAARRARGEQV